MQMKNLQKQAVRFTRLYQICSSMEDDVREQAIMKNTSTVLQEFVNHHEELIKDSSMQKLVEQYEELQMNVEDITNNAGYLGDVLRATTDQENGDVDWDEELEAFLAEDESLDAVPTVSAAKRVPLPRRRRPCRPPGSRRHLGYRGYRRYRRVPRPSSPSRTRRSRRGSTLERPSDRSHGRPVVERVRHHRGSTAADGRRGRGETKTVRGVRGRGTETRDVGGGVKIITFQIKKLSIHVTTRLTLLRDEPSSVGSVVIPSSIHALMSRNCFRTLESSSRIFSLSFSMSSLSFLFFANAVWSSLNFKAFVMTDKSTRLGLFKPSISSYPSEKALMLSNAHAPRDSTRRNCQGGQGDRGRNRPDQNGTDRP